MPCSRACSCADDEVFFNFTAIPGQGYRTIRASTAVAFERVENPTGPTARNIQQLATV
jgi:cold shock CspA family protein